MKIETVPIERIRVRQRIRQELGDLATLKNSIREHGLLNPILVDERFNLVAGERRLRAAQDLGWKEIEVRILDNRSRIELFDIESHENLLRKEFTAKELERSIEGKKRLLNPPWYARVFTWLAKLKDRLFPVSQRPVRPPASHRDGNGA